MQTSVKPRTLENTPVIVGADKKRAWKRTALKWLCKRLTAPDGRAIKSQRFRLFVPCAILFLIALGVRLLHWQDMNVEFMQENSMATTLIGHYETEAKRMEEDGGILFPSREVDKGDARMLIHPPGYAILLKWLYGTEHPADHYRALRMIQVVGDALSVVLLFLLAAELLPFAAAVIAGFLAAISPHLAYYSLWLSPDSLVAVPILAGVYLFIKACKQSRKDYPKTDGEPKKHSLLLPAYLALAAGVCFGLACWLRSNSLLLAPMFALLACFTFARGRRRASAIVLVSGMLAVIAPITIRNFVVYHRFVPLTIVSGVNLLQGIAEFDKEGKFGMPLRDADVALKDAEWHNRPEYAKSLWYPDGIERDEYRFRRGLEVIRKNPAWYARAILSRMAFMVRYNDFRAQNNNVFTSIAPTISSRPAFGHEIEMNGDALPFWQSSPAEMLSSFDRHSPQTDVELIGPDRLRLNGDSTDAEQLVSPPIPVKPDTDYIVTIPVALEQGRFILQVRTPDSLHILQKQYVYQVARRAKPAKRDVADTKEEKLMTPIELPFASGNQSEVRFVISNNVSNEQTALQAGEVQFFEVGRTPYQWTRPLRALARGLQKNIFKTDTMRLLIAGGLVLLLLARRPGDWMTGMILLAVPVYYLVTHAAFSTEFRYILPIHYFLFAVAATTIYIAGAAVQPGFRWLSDRWRAKG